tara:strand:+ start:687 stop:851 length:165 start_codon:yes stop_codon:yes gene_type:complete
MVKVIRILEIPLYLLVIAMACLERGNTITAIFLILMSVVRLVVNSITDEFNYKR